MAMHSKSISTMRAVSGSLLKTGDILTFLREVFEGRTATLSLSEAGQDGLAAVLGLAQEQVLEAYSDIDAVMREEGGGDE